jgi:hypothetical protein
MLNVQQIFPHNLLSAGFDFRKFITWTIDFFGYSKSPFWICRSKKEKDSSEGKAFYV